MVLQNVQVIDPWQGTITRRNLSIADGVISDDPDANGVSIDAQDLYVAPGFIDLHAHVFGLDNPRGIASVPADTIGTSQGVTLVVDAGSTGIDNYPRLANAYPHQTDIKFFVNVSRYGLQEGLSELADVNNLMSLSELERFKEHYGQDLVGIKVRMSASVVQAAGVQPLVHARALSSATGLPLMVHIGNAPPALDIILNLLQTGDIVTHYMHGKAGGILDYPHEYQAAASRGVRFDIGHGSSSFSFATARALLRDSDVSFSISTDLYKHNLVQPVGSLALCMSKFLTLGMDLLSCVQAVTSLPASYIGIDRPTLAHGQPANLTLFKVLTGEQAGQTTLTDSEGQSLQATGLIVPYGVIMGDTLTLL